MANGTATSEKNGPSSVKATFARPALKLQSDKRLAKLGALPTIEQRYRRPLEKHVAALIGTERAPAVVDQTFEQARGLFGADSRSNEPGPWLYWMAHNLAVADLKRDEPASAANGNGNGNGSVAHAGNGAAGASNGVATNGAQANGNANGNGQAHANGSNGQAHANGSNGQAHANGSNRHATGTTTNGSSNGAPNLFTTLTFTESAREFAQDSQTKKLVTGPRVRLRNGVGQLVPTTLLTEPAQASANGGSARPGARSAPAARPSNKRAALIVFGACLVLSLIAVGIDQLTNEDPPQAPAGFTGQPGQAPGTTPGSPDINGLLNQLGGQSGTTTPQTPPAGTTPPTTTEPGATPPASGESTTPGTTPETTAPGTTTPGTTPPATSESAPGETPPPSESTGTTSSMAGLLSTFKLLPEGTTAQSPPMALFLGFLGLMPREPASTTPKPAKTPKTPSLPPASSGSSGSSISPPPSVTSPPPETVQPAKPKPTPLGNAGPTISYVAARNQSNDVSVTKGGKTFTITDRGVKTLPLNTGCRAQGARSEICRTQGVREFDFKLGNRDDVIDLRVVTPATIAGEHGDDTITGGRGDDSLDGGSGGDRIEGGKGNDNIKGVTGEDQLDGNAGDDVITGGAENDSIVGGKGLDSLSGDAGDDSIDSHDGQADRVECGSGIDTVRADPIDTVAADCENVTRV